MSSSPASSSLTGPILIGSDIYRRSRYGDRHPLSIPRVSTAIDLARAMGWLAAGQYRDSPVATADELARFHDPAYIAVLMQAELEQRIAPDLAARHNLGRLENPLFTEMFRRPATAAGASILAGRLLAEAPGVIYSPAGGTHHGRPDRASGFCFVNDPVLAILALLDRGVEPVAYVDLDAHHCDGVQDAFAAEPRVLTVSIHEAGRWPGTGLLEDRGGGHARNLPVPAGFNDSELDFLMEAAVLPLVTRQRPAAIVVQAGADALAEDPLSRLELSNGALWRAVGRLAGLSQRVLVLGGGGYNPWSVGRCWAGIWAVLAGHDPAVAPTAAALSVLGGLSWNHSKGRNPPDHWLSTIADPPRPGPVRDLIRFSADRVLAP